MSMVSMSHPVTPNGSPLFGAQQPSRISTPRPIQNIVNFKCNVCELMHKLVYTSHDGTVKNYKVLSEQQCEKAHKKGKLIMDSIMKEG